MWGRWRTLAATDLRRPAGIDRRTYWTFLRAAFSCVVRGHKEPKMLHQYESVGSKGRVMVRDACSRCGFPMDESRSKLVQFPQPRGAEFQKWRHQ